MYSTISEQKKKLYKRKFENSVFSSCSLFQFQRA